MGNPRSINSSARQHSNQAAVREQQGQLGLVVAVLARLAPRPSTSHV